MVDLQQNQDSKGFIIPEKYLTMVFQQPKKKITAPEDIETFKNSQTYNDYMYFISGLQQSVKSKPFSQTPQNPKFKKLVEYLQRLEEIVAEVPPLEQKMRFGNTAFKTLHQKAMEYTDMFLDEFIPDQIKNCKVELITYLSDSYGSNVRLDYGSGHEMAFAFFLFALYRLGYYTNEDFESLTRNVFYKYIKLMRKIQLTYMLEPAGSHGVWGIDDYHFLPFLLGAAELVDHPQITSPNDINNQSLVDEFHEEFQYLDCIKFIKKVKKGPFHEHSPMLNDISGAATWAKIMNGMTRMYQAEVLFKFPVAKHIYFGAIIDLK